MVARVTVEPSTVRKVCVLTGETDRERGPGHFSNHTHTRFGMYGTDLGSSFEHGGRLWFLFGDTWPVEHATDHQDSVAWTTAASPGDGVPLTFVADGDPPRYRPPVIAAPPFGLPIPSAEFDVPCAGFSTGQQAYVFYTLDHRYDDGAAIMVRTALTRARDGDPTRLEWLYDASHVDHDGHFINVAPFVERQGIRGLPFDGPGLLLWGSGRYRQSHVYLAAVPLGQVEDRGAWRYYRGSEAGSLQPLWSRHERDSTALFLHPQVGELSVAWLNHLQLWLLLYNAGAPRGINGRVAASPWGPWSEPVVVFDPGWPGVGYRHFMHAADSNDGLSDPGREREWGGEYGPYLVDRFTTEAGPRTATVHFVLSTWNPYNTVLMRADIRRVDDVAVGGGVPAMVAAGLGREGHNLEVALPRTGGGLWALARSADEWPPAWGKWHLAGSEHGRTDADRPALDAVALASTSAGGRPGVLRAAGLTGGRVVEWWRDTTDPWHWNGPFPVVADGGYPLEGAAGNPALVASSYGAAHRNLELVVPHRERGIHHVWWDADALVPCWRAAPLVGDALGRVDAVTMIQSGFGVDGNLELVARVDDRLKVMWRENVGGDRPWRGPYPLVADGNEVRSATGVPSLVQGRYGARHRNFELAVPMRAGGIALFWRDNDGDDPARWTWHLHTFVDPQHHYDGVCLLEVPWGDGPGNLELVATGPGTGLVHFWRDATTAVWSGPYAVPVS